MRLLSHFTNLTWLLVLGAGIVPAQQVERPVADDLADQRTAATSQYQRLKAEIAEAGTAMQRLTGKDAPGSARVEGSFTELRIVECLADGDYFRQLSQIYSTAEASSGRVLDAEKASIEKSRAVDPELNLLHQQIDAIERRKAELVAGPTSTSAEQLLGLAGIEGKLMEALSVYQQMGTPDSDPDSGQLEQLRQLHEKFASTHQLADEASRAANTQCRAERQVLVLIQKREERQRELDSWGRLFDGSGSIPATSQPPKDTQRVTDEIKAQQQAIATHGVGTN